MLLLEKLKLSHSQGVMMPQTTLYFLFSDKHPVMVGGDSSNNKRRCIKYNATTDEWDFISTSLVGGG